MLKSQSNTQLPSSSSTRKEGRGASRHLDTPSDGKLIELRKSGTVLEVLGRTGGACGVFSGETEAHHCCAAELDPECGMNW